MTTKIIKVTCCGDCPLWYSGSEWGLPVCSLTKNCCPYTPNDSLREVLWKDLMRTIPDWCPLETLPEELE